jgi:1,4-alpha-glucan branching enzyme
MPFGAEVQSDGRVRFRLWSPSYREVKIELEGEAVAMRHVGEGWHELVTNRARADTRYRFVLTDGLRVPDPASR